MANDGTVKIGTELDEQGLKKGLSGLGGFAKKGFSVVGSAAAAASKVAVGAIAGVSSVMGGVAAAGLKYNATMENFMSDFTVMLGDMETAQSFVDDLKDMSAATPFEMSDLAQASKTLLAFGSDAESAVDQIKMLGDISLGNSQKLGTLSTAFGRIQSNGRASMEEINMMIDSGFNPLNIIAEKTGESMDELRKRVSSGGVSFEEISEAMKQATSEGGQFYKGMETASKTLDGQISTLKDNALALAGEIMRPLSEQLTTNLLPAAIGAVDQLTQAFREGGTEGLFQAGAKIISDLIMGIVQQLPSLVETSVSFLGTLISSLNENAPQLVSAGGQLLISLISGLYQTVPLLWELGWSIVSSIVEAVLGSLGEVTPAGTSTVEEFIDGILSGIPDLIESGGQLLTELVDKLLSGLPEFLSSGVELIGELASGLLKNAPAVLGAIASVIGQLLTTIASHLPELLQKGLELVGEIVAGLIQAIPDVISAAGRIVSDFWDEISKTDWLSLGSDIISGIINGLTSGLGKIAEAAKDVASKALDAAKDFLGIKSPSRLFRDVIGRNMIAGMEIGIEKETSNLEKVSAGSARKSVESFQENAVRHSGKIASSHGDPERNPNGSGGNTVVVLEKGSIRGEVQMDGEKVGELVAPTVDVEIEKARRESER